MGEGNRVSPLLWGSLGNDKVIPSFCFRVCKDWKMHLGDTGQPPKHFLLPSEVKEPPVPAHGSVELDVHLEECAFDSVHRPFGLSVYHSFIIRRDHFDF